MQSRAWRQLPGGRDGAAGAQRHATLITWVLSPRMHSFMRSVLVCARHCSGAVDTAPSKFQFQPLQRFQCHGGEGWSEDKYSSRGGEWVPVLE